MCIRALTKEMLELTKSKTIIKKKEFNDKLLLYIILTFLYRKAFSNEKKNPKGNV